MVGEAHNLPSAHTRCPECGSHLRKDSTGKMVTPGWLYCIQCDAAFDPEDMKSKSADAT